MLEAQSDRSSRRRGAFVEDPSLAVSGIIALLLVALAHFALVTGGNGEFFTESMLGSAYDALGQSLLSGDTQVPRAAIRWEAFEVEGRSVMYFGAFPAFLRIAANALSPSRAGLWAPAAIFLATMLSLIVFSLIAGEALVSNPRLSKRQKRVLLGVSVLGFGLGSPLFFLGSEISIYHEAVAWGLCWALLGVYFALRLLRAEAPRPLDLLGLSLAAGAALLSRATFGGPLYLLAAYFGLSLWRAARVSSRLAVAFALVPAAAMFAFQLWYNQSRFGSITTFIDFQYLAYLARDPSSWNVLLESGVFSAGRLPTALWAYFGPLPADWSGGFPWLRVAALRDLDPTLYPPLFDHFAISLSFSAGWLVMGGVVGTLHLFLRPHAAAWRIAAAVWCFQTVLVLCYYIVAQRYAADFLPCFVFGYAVLLGSVIAAPYGRLWSASLTALVALAVAVTTLGILAYPGHRDLPERIFGVSDPPARAWAFERPQSSPASPSPADSRKKS